jgi:molybdate transport system ATP-binding protein
MTLQVRARKQFPETGASAGFTLEVEFTANPGITILFGASGAGKTLTLDCIAGFVRPDAGRILLGDALLFDAEAHVNVRPQKRECGYVFQKHALFPHMSLRDNLFFAAERRPRLERHRRVGEMIERFRLADVAGLKPHEVSGGQKQRCSIARALITMPKVLLMDEPATGLDLALRSDLYGLLRELGRDYRIPMLLVTHDVDEAVMLGDRMLVYEAGRLVQSGAPQEVLSHPLSTGIASLVGDTSLISVEVLALDPARNHSRLRLENGEFAGPYLPGHLIGDMVRLAIRADAVRVYESAGPNRLKLKMTDHLERARAVELHFAGGVRALVPRSEFENANGREDWHVEIPAGSMKVLG